MIVREKPNWLRMLLIWRGSVLPRILPQLCFTTALATVVTITHGQLAGYKLTVTAVPFNLIGVALAIFLGFRNNASYERWWEARKLWGILLNDGRSFARQVLTLTSLDEAGRRRLVLGCAAYVQALRHQLRKTDPSADLRRLLPEEVLPRVLSARHPPAVVLVLLGEWLAEARRQGRLEPVLSPAIETSLGNLSQALGGCERIATTPIPFTYSVIIHRTVYCYCILLPFGLVDSTAYMTPLLVAFISYTFFALEELSDELEEPFGTMPNDLPVEAMAHFIEGTLRESLGEQNLPPLPEPVDNLLR